MNTLELPKSEDELTNIHQCMVAAAFESKRLPEAMTNFSIRLPEGVKDTAMYICKQNCTDLGTFLRECTKSLIRDYGAKVEE